MNPMLPFPPSAAAILGALLITTASLHAGSAAVVAARTQAAIDRGEFPAWWTPELPAEVARDVGNKAAKLASGIELDEAGRRRVTELLGMHFGRVWAWHQEVDADLDAAWRAWDEARSNAGGKEKDELRALAIMTERIDPIYAGFTPQIEALLRDLRGEVGEAATTRLLDAYTRSPGAERTYKAYLAMIPEMKEEEKAILWQRLVRAREESMAAWSGKRIIKIFKKHKVRNEFSIDYFGYDYRKRYKQWAGGGR